MNTKYCSNCGNELREDDVFCEKCGTKCEAENIESEIPEVVEQSDNAIFCEECGNKIINSDSFCSFCGAPVKQIPTQHFEQATDNSKPDKKKSKKKIVIISAISLVLVILIAVLGIIFLPKLFQKNKANEIETITITQTTVQPTTEQPTTEQPTTQAQTTEPKENTYILPDSDKTKLSNGDLANLNKEELELARNEIYARRGRKFDTDYIQEYFNSQSWYNGTINPDDFSEDMLSEIEKYNVNLIADYEEYLDSGAKRVSFGSYSLALPENWTYEVSDDGVYFYEKYNFTHEETGSTGFLCYIVSTSDSVEQETNQYPNSSLLGTKYGINYFVRHPMGIGIIEDETAQQKYHDALNEVNDVLETFQFE